MLVPPVKPLFPCGFVSFEYYDLAVNARPYPVGVNRYDVNRDPLFELSRKDLLNNNFILTFRVRNVGTFHTTATEITQLYVTFPLSCQEPPRQLKGFHAVHLQSGKSEACSFVLSARDLSIWDTNSHSWRVESGLYIFQIGSSSVEFHLHAEVVLE